MLQAFSQFLSEHMIAGAFILFLVFVVIQKLDKLTDHWIDNERDSRAEYHRERRERLERGAASLGAALLVLLISAIVFEAAAGEKHPISVNIVKEHAGTRVAGSIYGTVSEGIFTEAALIRDGASLAPGGSGWEKYTIYCSLKCRSLNPGIYVAYAEEWPLKRKTHIKITALQKNNDFSTTKAIVEDRQIADNAWALDWEQ